MELLREAWKILIEYWPLISRGIINTLIVSLLGTVIGLMIGLVIGALRYICNQRDRKEKKSVTIVKKIANFVFGAYVEIIRGTPMMVQAMLFYWGLKSSLQWDPFVASICIISVNTGAYMAEIIRSGIQSVDKGQGEGARSIGLSSWQTMQYVILPQALKNAFPSVGNEFVVNIKDSSVLNCIGFSELFLQAKSIVGSTFDYVTPFFVAGIIYFILTYATTFLLGIIEKRIGLPKQTMPTSQTMPAREE